MTACTPKEEAEWRSRLKQSGVVDPLETSETSLYNVIFLEIKSLGTVFGKPGNKTFDEAIIKTYAYDIY